MQEAAAAVPDAHVEPKAAAAEPPPFVVPERPTEPVVTPTEPVVPAEDYTRLTALLMDIELEAGKVGLTRVALEAKLKDANPEFKGLEELDVPGAERLLTGLQARVAAAGK